MWNILDSNFLAMISSIQLTNIFLLWSLQHSYYAISSLYSTEPFNFDSILGSFDSNFLAMISTTLLLGHIRLLLLLFNFGDILESLDFKFFVFAKTYSHFILLSLSGAYFLNLFKLVFLLSLLIHLSVHTIIVDPFRYVKYS